MSQEEFTLTRRGYKALQDELVGLEEDLKRYAQQLADVNADNESDDDPDSAILYDLNNAKARIEDRIAHVNYVLANAEVVDEDPNPTKIDPGERVTLWDDDTQEEIVFDLLSSPEAVRQRENDRDDGLEVTAISVTSPVGKALIGREVGDVIQVNIPDGVAKYTVRKIEQIPD